MREQSLHCIASGQQMLDNASVSRCYALVLCRMIMAFQATIALALFFWAVLVSGPISVRCPYHEAMFLLLQLRKQLALEAERQVEVEQAAADSDRLLLVPHWCTTEEPLHLIGILKAYSDLGFHPSHALLAAAEPFLSSVLHPIPLQQTLDLITSFRSFAWQPGQSCALALSS